MLLIVEPDPKACLFRQIKDSHLDSTCNLTFGKWASSQNTNDDRTCERSVKKKPSGNKLYWFIFYPVLMRLMSRTRRYLSLPTFHVCFVISTDVKVVRVVGSGLSHWMREKVVSCRLRWLENLMDVLTSIMPVFNETTQIIVFFNFLTVQLSLLRRGE